MKPCNRRSSLFFGSFFGLPAQSAVLCCRLGSSVERVGRRVGIAVVSQVADSGVLPSVICPILHPSPENFFLTRVALAGAAMCHSRPNALSKGPHQQKNDHCPLSADFAN